MKKIYLKLSIVTFITYLFSGCGGITPSISQEELQVDNKLPKVVLTQKGIVTDMNQVAFEWKPLGRTNIDGFVIYKKAKDSNTTKLLTTIDNRYVTHYVDLKVKPDSSYEYTLRSYKGDSVSVATKVPTVYTKPVLPSVSWIYAINGLPRMVKIIWRPHVNPRVEKYIIQRRSIDDDSWQDIATLKGRLQAEYIDKDLKDNYTYRYRIKVETFDGIISTPSEVVKGLTKPLPPQITGLVASTDLPKKIELHWNKSTYKDFERYYLYRSKDKNDFDSTPIAILYNNHYIDKIDQDGAEYFYKVTQKDLDGLESPTNEIVMGSTLPKPFPPTLQDAQLQGNTIVLHWAKEDPRSVRYIVKREAKTGWFDTQEKEFKTTSKKYIDKNILPNTKYTYTVYAVDKNGIISKPSNSVEIDVKELKAIPSNQQKQIHQKVQEIQKTVSKKADDEVITVENIIVDGE